MEIQEQEWISEVETDKQDNAAFQTDGSADLIITNVKNNCRIEDAARQYRRLLWFHFNYAVRTTGTPALGIGVGMEWVIETAASNFEIGSTVECKWANGGVGAENFTMDWRMMLNGTLGACSCDATFLLMEL